MSKYLNSLLTTDEVILVDTRQHWMALIRFALQPLLILGLAVFLWLLGEWWNPTGLLEFTNTLLTWATVGCFIVAIVWLPVQAVRWTTRVYALTNRRAIRAAGLLRKASFDSSLDQVNDVGFEQSFLGRMLGYGDLTILTASNANEQYHQLRDALNFKKAVLEAKEAMRKGQPLKALPDDLVVRGGTNAASIKAYSKAAAAAETAPAQAATSASTGGAAAGGAAVVAAGAAATAAAAGTEAPEVEPEEHVPAEAAWAAEAEAQEETSEEARPEAAAEAASKEVLAAAAVGPEVAAEPAAVEPAPSPEPDEAPEQPAPLGMADESAPMGTADEPPALAVGGEPEPPLAVEDAPALASDAPFAGDEGQGDPAAALAGLADMHDQGLISDEDYEAKKQDLLGRM